LFCKAVVWEGHCFLLDNLNFLLLKKCHCTYWCFMKENILSSCCDVCWSFCFFLLHNNRTTWSSQRGEKGPRWLLFSIFQFHIIDTLFAPPPPSLPVHFCANYCCEMLLGGLHIPKSISEQQFAQKWEGEQNGFMENWKIHNWF